MRKIKKLADEIREELDGARSYAECYLEAKVNNDSRWMSRYKEMAEDELKHSTYLHEKVVDEINLVKEKIVTPQKMEDKWERLHHYYIEEVATIKNILNM